MPRRLLSLLVLALALAVPAPAQDLTDDDRHKIFQAAAITGEHETILTVLKKIGLLGADGTPTEEYTKFLEAHGPWAEKNIEFVQQMTDTEKAKSFLASKGFADAGATTSGNGGGSTTGETTGGGATSGGAATGPIADEDAHRLFQAAAGTGDGAVSIEVWRRLGLQKEDGTNTEKYDKFMADHGPWAQKNLTFVQEFATPAKARDYLKKHLPGLKSLEEVKAFKGTEDERHRLWQAAAMTGEPATIIDVGKRLGLYGADGQPIPEALQRFSEEHGEWAKRSATFLQEIGEPEKAKAYVREQLK